MDRMQANGLEVKRDAAKNIIEKNGGTVLSSVSKKLKFLLAGTDAGSKLEKAQKLGIEVIDWNHLGQLIENNNSWKLNEYNLGANVKNNGGYYLLCNNRHCLNLVGWVEAGCYALKIKLTGPKL